MRLYWVLVSPGLGGVNFSKVHIEVKNPTLYIPLSRQVCSLCPTYLYELVVGLSGACQSRGRLLLQDSGQNSHFWLPFSDSQPYSWVGRGLKLQGQVL